ncbi:TIGR04219 family outer membrane beta-barrel protein [Spongiibacter tropicus]|uniref:TIGR04219 family outer membrane beta-barrel protein n=1 Tax=Spongiibacter tropicus TaxID=454602 RepID=UPI003A9A4467
MKKQLLAMAVLAGAASVTQADIIGASAGAYYWKQSWDGDVQSGPDSIDTKKDLGYDEDNGTSIYVALEHPVPVLPNIRLQRTDIEISEKNQLSRNFTFEGDVYTVADTVDSTTDLTHTDATFYYELLDNWVNLDLGLTVRMFDGEVRLATTGREGSIELDAPVPMLYANARFNLPLTGLYAQAVGNVISVSDNSVTDLAVGIGYEVAVVSLEAGYRSFDVSLEDDDEEAGITVDGVYFGINIDI